MNPDAIRVPRRAPDPYPRPRDDQRHGIVGQPTGPGVPGKDLATIGFACDRCSAAGVDFLGGEWLCQACRRSALIELQREVYCYAR
jgi:hypothetical protein